MAVKDYLLGYTEFTVTGASVQKVQIREGIVAKLVTLSCAIAAPYNGMHLDMKITCLQSILDKDKYDLRQLLAVANGLRLAIAPGIDDVGLVAAGCVGLKGYGYAAVYAVNRKRGNYLLPVVLPLTEHVGKYIEERLYSFSKLYSSSYGGLVCSHEKVRRSTLPAIDKKQASIAKSDYLFCDISIGKVYFADEYMKDGQVKRKVFCQMLVSKSITVAGNVVGLASEIHEGDRITNVSFKIECDEKGYNHATAFLSDRSVIL